MSPLIHLSQERNDCEESPGEIFACRVLLTLGLLILLIQFLKTSYSRKKPSSFGFERTASKREGDLSVKM